MLELQATSKIKSIIIPRRIKENDLETKIFGGKNKFYKREKDKKKIKCVNYNKKGHFTCECISQKRFVLRPSTSIFLLVVSYL